MTGIVDSVNSIVGAGVKSLCELAEGYMKEGPDRGEMTEDGHVRAQSHDEATEQSTTLSTLSTSSSTAASSASGFFSSETNDSLIQADVASGWIHVQAAYLDDKGGQRTTRSFGVRNISDNEVQVEVQSDLGNQLLFWSDDDEKGESNSLETVLRFCSDPIVIILCIFRLVLTLELCPFEHSAKVLTNNNPRIPAIPDSTADRTPTVSSDLGR